MSKLWLQTWAGAGNSLFPAPPAADHASWLDGLHSWRKAARSAAGLDDDHAKLFEIPGLKWTQTSYIQPQVHTFDRMLWNETSGSYSVDRYLDDVQQRYGGIDSVLLWPTYPNIGLDERNQFDMLRLSGLEEVIAKFHARGVPVLLPYNPWDEATRREGKPDHVVLAELSAQVLADGFNGDTMQRVGKEFWDASVAAGRPIAIEPEGGGYPDTNGTADLAQWNATSWTPLGWAYHWIGTETSDNETTVYLDAPGVDRAKWLEPHGRHLTHVTDRWRKQRLRALQLAFFNANGYEAWENVWGLWNGITPRDGEAIRRVATLLRFFGANNYTRNYAPATGWVPHTPEAVGASVHASRFERSEAAGGGRVWLMVNVGSDDASGPVLRLDAAKDGCDDALFIDLYHGDVLRPSRGTPPAARPLVEAHDSRADEATPATVELTVPLEAHGFGAVLALCGAKAPPPAIAKLMETMKPMTKVPLKKLDGTWRPLPQRMEAVPSSEVAAVGATPPPEMVAVPRNRKWLFSAAGVEVEGGCDPSDDPNGVCCTGDCSRWDPSAPGPPQLTNCQCGMEAADDAGNDVQFPWESDGPHRNHAALLDIGPFWIDRTPVTRDEFARYLRRSGYRPADPRGFLPQWATPASAADGSGSGEWADGMPPGSGALPVTGVSHEEAAAYCHAAGKRLPTTYEWQFAAQGNSSRKFPWGDALDRDRFPPVQHANGAKNISWSGPTAVDAYAKVGASPFGMVDVVGNVWQWTASEFVDPHTRSVILRGSSSYVPLTDPYLPPAPPMKFSWYFQPALQLDRHNRWLAQRGNLAYSRAATVGFRCLKDVAGGAPAPFHYRSATALRA